MIARLGQAWMFLSVYTILASPRTSLIFPCHHPLTALQNPPVQPYIAPSIRVLVHGLAVTLTIVCANGPPPCHAKGQPGTD
jgi:hypothetical protein